MLVIAQKGSDCLETLRFIGLQSNVSRTPRQDCNEIPKPERKVRLPLDLGRQGSSYCLGRRFLYNLPEDVVRRAHQRTTWNNAI